ncbi:MAG: hypothetical protein K0U36_01530 [Alphaproteobacteria bacterium]|nr:hypothetical protein [Alphaproteobacteria bacterium]
MVVAFAAAFPVAFLVVARARGARPLSVNEGDDLPCGTGLSSELSLAATITNHPQEGGKKKKEEEEKNQQWQDPSQPYTKSKGNAKTLSPQASPTPSAEEFLAVIGADTTALSAGADLFGSGACRTNGIIIA